MKKVLIATEKPFSKAAVEKISGEEDNEAYLTRIKNEDKVNKIKRRPISFFEYEFRATVPQS